MIVKIFSSGASFRGAGKYYLHDKPYEDEQGKRVLPVTSQRIPWSETRNLFNDDPEIAMSEMWKTAFDQPLLREMSGHRVFTTAKPVKTLVLSWRDGDAPDKAQMVDAADSYLEHMGWQDHQAVYIPHNDEQHAHLHVVMNIVHPETGMPAKDGNEKKRSQVWALAYEREHGDIQCAARLEKDYQTFNDAKHPRTPISVHKEGEAVEADYNARNDAQEKADKPDRDLLHGWHSQEREAFFARSKGEFRDVRQAAYLEIKNDFKEVWREHFKAALQVRTQAHKIAQVSGEQSHVVEAQEMIDAAKREISDHQKEVLNAHQQAACQIKYDERNEEFQSIKERQKNERLELKVMGETLENGGSVDQERLHYLRTGEKTRPTDANHLMRDLASANQNQSAGADKQSDSANDNAPLDDADAQRVNDPWQFLHDEKLNPRQDPRTRDFHAAELLRGMLEPESPFQMAFHEAMAQEKTAKEHRAALRASEDITESGSMARVQLADIKLLQQRQMDDYQARFEKGDKAQERGGGGSGKERDERERD